MKQNLVNLTLRSITLISKFVLLLYIAKYLSPSDLGIYGLINAAITMAIYFLGMDFYIYNTRELLKYAENQVSILIRDQLIFHFLTYIFVLPLLLILFFINILPWDYIIWFYILLVLEHLSQESYRILITLSKAVYANSVLFFRSGAWCYVIIFLMMIEKLEKSLPTIWIGWIIGILCSLLVTYYALRKLVWQVIWSTSINWMWIKNGIYFSLPYLLGTISLKTVEYSDRFFLSYFYGVQQVGIYTLFSSIANVVQVFVFTGVISILYPKIIKTYQQGNLTEYKLLMNKMFVRSLLSGSICILLSYLLIHPVLIIINKPIFFQHIETYWLLLIATFLIITSQCSHYELFVKEKHKEILFCTAIGSILTILADIALVPYFGLNGAAVGLILGNMGITFLKYWFCLKYR